MYKYSVRNAATARIYPDFLGKDDDREEREKDKVTRTDKLRGQSLAPSSVLEEDTSVQGAVLGADSPLSLWSRLTWGSSWTALSRMSLLSWWSRRSLRSWSSVGSRAAWKWTSCESSVGRVCTLDYSQLAVRSAHLLIRLTSLSLLSWKSRWSWLSWSSWISWKCWRRDGWSSLLSTWSVSSWLSVVSRWSRWSLWSDSSVISVSSRVSRLSRISSLSRWSWWSWLSWWAWSAWWLGDLLAHCWRSSWESWCSWSSRSSRGSILSRWPVRSRKSRKTAPLASGRLTLQTGRLIGRTAQEERKVLVGGGSEIVHFEHDVASGQFAELHLVVDSQMHGVDVVVDEREGDEHTDQGDQRERDGRVGDEPERLLTWILLHSWILEDEERW